MAWKKSKLRRTPPRDTRIIAAKARRIFIPQPAHRPISLHSKDLIRRAYVRQSPSWFTMRRIGVRREKLGGDPREMRAVSRSQVRGTLPERIVYFFLMNRLHLVPDVDFTFQSSQSGGRMELGGIVADFLLPIMRIVIQVQGPTHGEFLRSKKDQEQMDILADLGYRTFEAEDTLIYDEQRLENWMRRVFNLGGFGATSGRTTTEPVLYVPPIVTTPIPFDIPAPSVSVPSAPVIMDEATAINEEMMELILSSINECIIIVRS